ncbi:MAG: tetratricopeptide repeat protein [Proteobacteria bacterium]|nr:tetratricopeptide repeat protein [Pseudomonadota bacterium]
MIVEGLDEASVAAQAVTALAAGRFQDALRDLRLAVARHDPSPATLLNLAIAEDRVGDRQRARALMQQVAVRQPDWDEPIVRLAESLRADNDLAGAEEAYRHALSLQPNRPAALIALGALLLKRNEATEARNLLLHCCGIAPDNAEAWFALGLALNASQAPSQALSAFLRAQALDVENLVYALYGVEAAVAAGEAEAELARLELRAQHEPLNHVPLAARAMLLDRLGEPGQAIDVMEAVTILAPDAAAPWGLLGGLLARTTQVVRAETVLRRAWELAPDNPLVANDYAAVLMKLHRHPDARRILQSLQERFSPHPSPLCNLANATVYVGRQEEAASVARQAIALAPEASLPRRALCNVLPYDAATTPQVLLAALADASATLARVSQADLRNTPVPDRRLRLGLLSGSFRSHPVGWLTVAGFETLDPEQFEIVCLSRAMSTSDPITARFRTLAHEWVDTDRLDDAALTAAARQRDIDILIDLGGYGDGGRMAACANRLAPVQIKWVGMQNHSTGLPEMDWFLTDRWETPPGFEPFYTERLLRLPDGYVCYSPPTHAPDVTPLPALSNGFITFGCFNNLAKITSQVIETWSTILHRVPRSRLLLKSHPLADAETAAQVLAAFARHGVERDRVELRGSSGHRAFLQQLSELDINLDPFPYTGGLTTCEALWMGVPTQTLSGTLFSARHSTSHLSNVGLSDWVAPTLDDYVESAVTRAQDLASLAQLRSGLRTRVRVSPLCDALRFGTALGTALRHAWQDWCAGRQSGAALNS